MRLMRSREGRDCRGGDANTEAIGIQHAGERGVGVLVAADAVRSTCHIAMSSIT